MKALLFLTVCPLEEFFLETFRAFVKGKRLTGTILKDNLHNVLITQSSTTTNTLTFGQQTTLTKQNNKPTT
jgi:hypothetical protein